MYRAFLVLFVVACGHANRISPVMLPNSDLDGRIVGGHDINIKEAPYQVSVREGGYHVCGGSIISNKAILTAAHCFEKPDYYYSIQYGVTNCGGYTNVIYAGKVVKHEWYNGDTHDYDVALIFLEKYIPFSDVAKPISLAQEDPNDWDAVTVTGWGALYENGHVSAVLQSVYLTVKKRKVCQDQYAKIDKVITARMLCVGYYGGGKDACQADSGGPLTMSGVQVGVVSWGWGCARPDFFGLYSSVATLRPWIEKQLKSNS